VGFDTDPVQLGNEYSGVVILVGADHLLVSGGQISGHRLGRVPLAVAIGRCDAAVNDQVIAVVHEHMASVAGHRWMNDGLARQQGIGIGSRSVGLVAELDATEVARSRLFALLGCSESLAWPGWWRRWILLAIDPLR